MTQMERSKEKGLAPHLKTTIKRSPLCGRSFSSEGFTMVEIIVTIFILGLALAAIYGILSVDMASATASKNNYTASMLAQEGVELVRNFRDSDWLAGREFGSLGGLGGPVNGVFAVEWSGTTLLPAEFADEYLEKDSNGVFSYDGGGDTLFKRAITIDETTDPGVEIIVRVDVTWTERGLDKKLSAEDHLFNWYQK
jgi:prepilin-type N-terminal cleavage/methylation domain-containing protein